MAPRTMVDWRDARVAEGARLESECALSRTEGSNPSLSAKSWEPNRSPRGDTLQTPPGPEGSNGSNGLERRGVAGLATTINLQQGMRFV